MSKINIEKSEDALSLLDPVTSLNPDIIALGNGALDLPVLGYEQQIKALIEKHQIAIIIGATGSGKTTEIGRMMSDLVNGKIATTQPRRPAAVSVAEYVSAKRGQILGTEVGYHIRFNDTTNKGTVLDYVTDGILIEQLLATKVLPEYSGIILDEAHIRNLNVDFLMGLILQVNERRLEMGMTQLKILITSATIPAQQFSDFFGGAPVLEIPGRMYPVKVHFEKQKPKDYIVAAFQKVKKVIQEGVEGDILIFMPGEYQIRQTINTLSDLDHGDMVLLPFFGQQSLKEQEKVFLPSSKRKIIVATNIAETSLTIPGVRIVIDTGLQRVSIFDPKTGISKLVDEDASIAAIEQRKGRAGRTDTGICYRLFPEDSDRPLFDVPEIKRTDLAGTVLKMKRLGIDDILNFKFIDPPEKNQIRKAAANLKVLGALDDDENITEIGKLMANLPLDPHLARMVVEADRFGCVDAICTIAAFMSSKSAFERSGPDLNAIEQAHLFFKTDHQKKPISDPQSFLKIWDEYEKNRDNPTWVTQNFLNLKVLQEIELIRGDLIQTLKRHEIGVSKIRDPIGIAKSVLAGNISNLLQRIGREEYVRMIGPGEEITIHPSSALRNQHPLAQFLSAAEIMTNASGFTSAFSCQPVELEWVPQVGSQILSEKVIGSQYNPKTDEAVKVSKFFLKYDGRELVSQKKTLENSTEAVGLFASYLTSLISAVSKRTRNEWTFIEQIQILKDEIDVWHAKSQGQIKTLSSFDLGDLFFQRLLPLGICTQNQLRQALRTNELNLDFKITDFISEAKLAKISAQNPLFVTAKGKNYPVFYYKNKHKFWSRIEIPTKDLAKLELEDLDLEILYKHRPKKQILIKPKSDQKNYQARPVEDWEEIVDQLKVA
jgi:HrpA-like RNA helicase